MQMFFEKFPCEQHKTVFMMVAILRAIPLELVESVSDYHLSALSDLKQST